MAAATLRRLRAPPDHMFGPSLVPPPPPPPPLFFAAFSLDRGLLAFTSAAMADAQCMSGCAQCPACHTFKKWPQGLRDHLQRQHLQGFGAASHVVDHVVRPAQLPASCSAPGVEAARSASGTLCGGASDAGFDAARAGDCAALEALLLGGWRAADAIDRHGSGPVSWAAGAGQVEACRLLAAAGCSAGAGQKWDSHEGRTAAHWAARNGHLPVLAWLHAEAGADVDPEAADGTRPLQLASWRGHLSVVLWLLDSADAQPAAVNRFGCNAAHWAGQTGNIEIAAVLAARGCSLRALNKNGHSLLHKSALGGHAPMCEWLLREAALGPECMQADGEGSTPAQLAALAGHGALAARLESAAATQLLRCVAAPREAPAAILAELKSLRGRRPRAADSQRRAETSS